MAVPQIPSIADICSRTNYLVAATAGLVPEKVELATMPVTIGSDDLN